MSEKKTILVVDDYPGLREGLKMSLSFMYHVLTAEKGEDALEVLATHYSQEGAVPIFAILTDYNLMGTVSGEGFVGALQEKYPDVPIIVLTGDNTLDVEGIKGKGARDVIFKGDVGNLVGECEQALNRLT